MDNLNASESPQPKICQMQRWAGTEIVKRIPPMPIYAFCRNENLADRFDRIYDPMPGRSDLANSLHNLNPAFEITKGDLKTVPANPQAMICAPDPRKFYQVAKFGLENNFEYIALFAHCMQLAGLKRFESLYSKTPPHRIYLVSEACSFTRRNRGGSNGAWQPAIWAVWDAQTPLQPPKQTTIHWIGDSSRS